MFSSYAFWGGTQQRDRHLARLSSALSKRSFAIHEGNHRFVNIPGVDLAFANRGSISEGEIAELMAEYEATHAVEDYWALGWQVWPILRTALAGDIQIARNVPGAVANLLVFPRDEKGGIGRLTRAFRSYSLLLRDYVRWAWDLKRGTALAPSHSCDVLIFGAGERYQLVDGTWIHHATDPLADLLEHAGLRCHMWRWQEQPSPAARPSANVVPLLRADLALSSAVHRFSAPPSEPDWFPEFASFYHGQLDQRLSWGSLVANLASMMPMSIIFERWLRRTRPGLVVLDNWCNGPMFAAALASQRLGIPVMDLQHGIQEHTHNYYHCWHKAPPGGWPGRPDIFWVWGARTETLFHETNRIGQEILRGGSLWIRRWLSNTDPHLETACAEVRRLLEGYSRSILVTLTNPPSRCLRYLKDTIAKSPKNWIWLVRSHPREIIDRQRIEQELGCSARVTVRAHNATEWPLYALLREVDLHVSVESTCANEALAFGKPTVLISETGLLNFREFVDAGVMFYAECPEDFYDAVDRALQIGPARLKHAACSVFSMDEDDTTRAVARIVEIVQSVRKKQALGSLDLKSFHD